MNPPHDPNRTVDVPSGPADSLGAGLAAGFSPPRSSLQDLRPVLLKEAAGDRAPIVQPKSDAMPPPEQAGDRYQLQGEIARGGMGAVLHGRDVDLGRDLAVKVLLEKYADRPEVARRFIEEAQIGGQLQHPGVVPVYDIGRIGDRPFFTMKLVKGHTLAAIKGDSTDPASNRPGFLAIILKVAQTLAYAHAKGVIHRDLKPANIMIGGFGEVLVMDWGLAKVLAEGGVADEERASREREQPVDVTTIRTARSSGSTGSFGSNTEAGALLGTPAYMPPEQANGDIANLDRRADVFGLGAILCEILTGKPPYVGRSSEEVRRKACNGDLADAHVRLDACGADAELIVLTKACLCPEAIDRPKDAQAVAGALRHYLDGVQERLHQAELAEAEARARAVEEAKRRRLTLALAGTVLLALALGGGGWLWVKNERDSRQAQVARDVHDALNQATALREQAMAAPVGGAALFSQAREQAQRALALVENGPADEALKTQVTRLQTELDEEETDRQLVAALDTARLAQAETLSENRFAPERAVPLFREAFRAYGLAAGKGKPAAAAERIRGRPAAVRDAAIAALDEWADLAGNPKYKITEPNLDWLRGVVAAGESADNWNREFRAMLAEPDAAKRHKALEKLATEVDVRKQSPWTLTRLAERLEEVEQAGAGSPHATGPPGLQLLRRAQQQYPADFWINHNLGMGLVNRENATPHEKDEAVRFLTAAVALRPQSPGVRLNLGLALQRKGQLDQAIACYDKALALDPRYAAAHINLGNALQAKGQLDEAIASFRKAVSLDPKFAWAHNGLGSALYGKGQVDEAIACLRKAIELEPKYALAHNNLGHALDDKGQVDEAIACYRKALALDPKNALAHNNLGAALCDRKRDFDGAIVSFRKAIALDPKDAAAHTNLGNALNGKGQVDEAIACYHKALPLDPKFAMAHFNLGNALDGKGQIDEAITCYRKAIALDPKYTAAHNNLGNALGARGRVDEAIAYFRKAIELDPKNARAHRNLGLALQRKGQVDETIACFQKALALDPQFAPAQTLLARAKQWAAARDKFVAFQNGRYTPASNEERLGLAEWCKIKKLHHTATRLYAAAFAADPKLADDLQAADRYSAACHAALAAADQGEEAVRFNDQERGRLRKQALGWLRADLALRTKQLESGQSADRAAVQGVLAHWQKDRDLAGLRDPAALAKLPPEDRAACAKLWADVAALLNEAGSPAPREVQP
jgi:serine/threonine-protein kinase